LQGLLVMAIRAGTIRAGGIMTMLSGLHLDIDARVQAIRGNRPDWPCAKGCDGCCRRLAEVPRLAAAEWDLLREGLAALPAERLREIRRAVAALAGQGSRPVVCPLLDQAAGACTVYARRPVACRTYGFYVQRDLGLYCHDIETRVAAGTLADVVWGNHDAIDHRLAGFGEMRPLTEWFKRWESGE
jgi:Fe-S-cluster containining protein